VVDGTTVQLADTRKNQQRYPQLPHQKPGCGFPLLKLLALFSLSSGAILTVIMDSYHNHDLRLFRRLWEEIKTGDVILGDRLFGDYATLADLPRRGIDVIARLNVKRKVDFRKAKRLGPHDGLFVWTKSHLCPPYLTSAQWAEISAVLTVRIVRFRVANGGSRTRSITLVTTLLDPKLYPLEELAISTRGGGGWNCASAISKPKWGWNSSAVRPRPWPRRKPWPIWWPTISSAVSWPRPSPATKSNWSG
jgi:hypothetical protein